MIALYHVSPQRGNAYGFSSGQASPTVAPGCAGEQLPVVGYRGVLRLCGVCLAPGSRGSSSSVWGSGAPGDGLSFAGAPGCAGGWYSARVVCAPDPAGKRVQSERTRPGWGDRDCTVLAA